MATIEDMKKMGLIEVNGIWVKASSQVAKGKPDKLPNLLERAIPIVETEDIGIIPPGAIFGNHQVKDVNRNTNGSLTLTMQPKRDPYLDQQQSAYAKFKTFKEHGVIYQLQDPFKNETFQLPDGGYIYVLYSFDIAPVSAPRMTQSDKWKIDPNHSDENKRQRKPVGRYFKFKRDLLSLCAENGYKLTNRLNILFIVPMPKSWSKKKRLAMDNEPHKQRPDRDNYLKAFQDSFDGDDGHVWDGRSIKLWGQKGRIIIF